MGIRAALDRARTRIPVGGSLIGWRSAMLFVTAVVLACSVYFVGADSGIPHPRLANLDLGKRSTQVSIQTIVSFLTSSCFKKPMMIYMVTDNRQTEIERPRSKRSIQR